MDFNLDLNTLVTTVTALGLVGAFRMLLNMKSDVDVLKSHKINTEEMRSIMKDTQAPVVESQRQTMAEVHHLREEVEAMRAQIAGRRASD